MTYISLLRGINVAGKNKIKMADLKAGYEALGFHNVRTYIQSGNVLFESDSVVEPIMIEGMIKKTFGFEVPVWVRTQDSWKQSVKAFPFGEIDVDKEGTVYLLTCLDEAPKAEDVALLQDFVKAPEQLVIVGKDVYLHTPNGYGKSKLSNVFIEKKLRVRASTRNWKTVLKLADF